MLTLLCFLITNISIVLVESAAVSVVEEGESRNGKCRFSVVKDTIIPQLVGCSFPKDSPIRRAFDAG